MNVEFLIRHCVLHNSEIIQIQVYLYCTLSCQYLASEMPTLHARIWLENWLRFLLAATIINSICLCLSQELVKADN